MICAREATVVALIKVEGICKRFPVNYYQRVHLFQKLVPQWPPVMDGGTSKISALFEIFLIGIKVAL